MNVEMVNTIIDSISNKLSVPTEYILQMFARSGVFNITYVIMLTIVLILFIILTKFSFNRFKNSSDFNEIFNFYCLCICCLIISITFIFLCVKITGLINWLIDPEVYAFNRLMNTFLTYSPAKARRF